MSLATLVKSLPIFLGLGLSSVSPLAFSSKLIPDLNERKWELSKCVMSSWAQNTFFKCLNSVDGLSWVFFLNQPWQRFSRGSSSTTDANNSELILEKGHEKISFPKNNNKTLDVFKKVSSNGKVVALLPSLINKADNKDNLLQQIDQKISEVERELISK